MKRTSRKIWDLFELKYPHRLSRFRAWKRYLSASAATIAAVWVGVAAVREDQSLHSSGPMSLGHTVLTNQCAACHVQPWQGLAGILDGNHRNQEMNKACLSCHANSIGYETAEGSIASRSWSAWHEGHDSIATKNSSETVACASCHIEHEGPGRLVEMSDARCVRCHTDLTERVSNGRFAHVVTSFSTDHPEFDVIADKLPDVGTIKLNHNVHMAKKLRGLLPSREQMSCDDCHRAGLGGYDWPYGRSSLHESNDMRAVPQEPQLQAAYMNEIRYSKHCAGCHDMASSTLSSMLGRSVALPHTQPEAVRTVLNGVLTSYIEGNLEELMANENKSRSRRPTAIAPESKAVTNQLVLEWVRKKRSLVEQELYRDAKRCLLCHAIEPTADAVEEEALPIVSKGDIPARWLMHASFNHEKHRVLDCLECHPQAPDSTSSAEVMMPAIETCRRCHSERAVKPDWGGVSYGCVMCHSYHMPPVGPAVSGLKLDSLLSGKK